MNVAEKAAALVDHIRSLNDFVIVDTIDYADYNHMGATITDAMLQAGVKWESVVQPRIKHLLHRFPEVRTTSGFLRVLGEVGHRELLKWKHQEKPTRVLGVARFFRDEGIEAEKDLRRWLEQPGNVAKLKEQRGIGDKTVDYFKMLVGIPTNAVDRHLLGFLCEANIEIEGRDEAHRYDEAHRVIDKAADLAGVNRRLFDHSIWKHMSGRKIRNRGRLCRRKAG